MALPAYAEAVRFYQMALEALERLEHVDEAQRRRLLLLLGGAQRKSGEHLQALDTLQRAADSARQQGALEDLARAAIEFELATWNGRLSMKSAVRLAGGVKRARRGQSDTAGKDSEQLSPGLIVYRRYGAGSNIRAAIGRRGSLRRRPRRVEL